MVNIGAIHYAYLIIILGIFTFMWFKKDVILPCIIGIGIIGFMATGNILKSVQVIYNAVFVSGKEFLEIIVIISLVNAMSKALTDVGADELMIKPIKKMMVNEYVAFFVIGITMMITSWFIWPTPAVAFIGAIMVPAAVKAGLPPIWAAVSLSLFGKGAALSSDFFIQAAPAITAKTARIDNPFKIITASIPFWLIMSLVTVAVSFFFMKKDLKSGTSNKVGIGKTYETKEIPKKAKLIAAATPIIFLSDVVFMYIYKLKGTDATALIGGTAVIIMCGASIIVCGFKIALGKVAAYIKDGFIFGIKVFAPIIIVSAFFFLGSKETASEILGMNAKGILTDVGMRIAEIIPLSKISIILVQVAISALLGIGGSGFGGLPLIGTLAQVFSTSININKEEIAALGQVITIWIGGGTIIPWSVVQVAAICDVQPMDLVKKNLIPIIIGVVVTTIMSIFFI